MYSVPLLEHPNEMVFDENFVIPAVGTYRESKLPTSMKRFVVLKQLEEEVTTPTYSFLMIPVDYSKLPKD